MGKTFRKDAKNDRWRKEKQRRQEKQHKRSAFESRANFYIVGKETYGDEEAWLG